MVYALCTACRPASQNALPSILEPVMNIWIMALGDDYTRVQRFPQYRGPELTMVRRRMGGRRERNPKDENKFPRTALALT